MSDKPIIKYTARDFESIRDALVEYTKRYYPNTFKDFSVGSPLSWYINLVSYLGDQLSFNQDYLANESFLDSANEARNVIRLGRANGYNHNPARCSFGFASFYIKVPAHASLPQPDRSYLPILRKGTEVSATNRGTFLLTEDVDFRNENNTVVVSETNQTTGAPTFFAVKTYGAVVSGEIVRKEIAIGDFQKFLKINIGDTGITEIISVTDSSGNEYYEVDSLSTDVVFKSVVNRSLESSVSIPNIIKPFPVPRRFVFFFDSGKYYLQFGHGSEEYANETSSLDPSNVILQRHGRNYISDSYFDPSKLIETDKLGVSPSNTELTITYRKNSRSNSDSAVGTLSKVSNAKFDFGDSSALSQAKMRAVVSSIEVDNEDPIIGDVYTPNIEEIKARIRGAHGSQGRAVTKQDYEAIVYNMPSNFGAVKRCKVASGKESGERVINIYTVCEDANGHLAANNDIIKENLKIWIGRHKMMNDSIQLLDAKVVNFGVDFVAVAKSSNNRSILFNEIMTRLKKHFENHMFIGEPINLVDIYAAINSVDGVADTTTVLVQELVGGLYSSTRIGLEKYTSQNGKMVLAPEDVIYELKYPNFDIRGIIK